MIEEDILIKVLYYIFKKSFSITYFIINIIINA